MQQLTFIVTVRIANTESIKHNAQLLADNITGWNCSAECECSMDVIKATVNNGDVTAKRDKG
jgi:hypothetical protein